MDLLKRVRDALYLFGSFLDEEDGEMRIVRDLLREIDEALKTGHICDCHEHEEVDMRYGGQDWTPEHFSKTAPFS